MSLQYQGRKSGEIFEEPPGARNHYSLSGKEISLTTEYISNDPRGSQTGEKSYIRVIYTGSFGFSEKELSSSLITDVSMATWQYGEEVAWSVHFDDAINKKPHQLTSIDTASRVNYSYRSSGDTRPTGNSLLASHPVTNSRSALFGHTWSDAMADGWWVGAFQKQEASPDEASAISAPSRYGKGSADIITNYNPKSDSPIQIELSGFDGALGKLKIAKKTKQVAKLAKKNTDFIYDQQAGYLYYNENGKQAGFGDGGIFAILEGSPRVGVGNFEFM